MPIAAENPAGGLAGAGVGVGMGMAMAHQWAPGAPAPGGAPAAPLAPPPPPAAWHIVENGATVGPFGGDQLAQAVAAGRLRPDTLVWTAGMSGWLPAAQVAPLAPLFQASPPPRPEND
jgi:hypothetical protein